MHGLVNRAIQSFVRDTYGEDLWAKISDCEGLPICDFESLNTYPDSLTYELVDRACVELGKPRVEFLEDLGTYLVAHKNCEKVRRLLRFGGESFTEFLFSLDDLPERIQLALPDFGFPDLDMRASVPGSVSFLIRDSKPGFAEVLTGLLRAMSDDYGALSMIEMADEMSPGTATISVTLLDLSYAEAKSFSLAGNA